MTRRYVTEISPLIGPERDIPAPDVGTNAQVMAWIMDTLSMHRGYSIPASVTGKPVSIGGTVGRESATGLGVTYITRSVMKQRMGRGLDDATVAVQGFGNVGSWTARDHARARCPHRRHQRQVWRHLQQPRHRSAHAAAPRQPTRARWWALTARTRVTNEELLTLDVDVLVPAALEGQITKHNAHKVRATHRGRGRQRPDYARGRRDPAGQGHPGHPRHHLQRRRRGRLLL